MSASVFSEKTHLLLKEMVANVVQYNDVSVFRGCLADVAPTAATHQLMVPTMILWWAQTLNLRVTMVIHIGKREDWRLDAAVVRFCVWGIERSQTLWENGLYVFREFHERGCQ